MSDLQAIADRVEIEALRSEFTDAVMMHDYDRYQRTADGWKFTERVYEVRYLDTTPLAGSGPHPASRFSGT
jgi:hypothetical protein